MKIETQINKMLDVMSEGIYEKEHILAMTLLSAIAGESIFLLALNILCLVFRPQMRSSVLFLFHY